MESTVNVSLISEKAKYSVGCPAALLCGKVYCHKQKTKTKLVHIILLFIIQEYRFKTLLLWTHILIN